MTWRICWKRRTKSRYESPHCCIRIVLPIMAPCYRKPSRDHTACVLKLTMLIWRQVCPRGLVFEFPSLTQSLQSLASLTRLNWTTLMLPLCLLHLQPSPRLLPRFVTCLLAFVSGSSIDLTSAAARRRGRVWLARVAFLRAFVCVCWRVRRQSKERKG